MEMAVRTNIEIDDALMAEAMAITGLTTKKAVVEAALQRVVQIHRQMRALEEMKGMGWEGDLDEMRAQRHPEWS